MPGDWSPICGVGFAGRVRFRRRFHWPSPLTPRERLRLVFDEIVGSAHLHLNETDLGAIAAGGTPASFEITHVLQPTNVLIVEITHIPSPDSAVAGGIPGEVRLEVFHESKS